MAHEGIQGSRWGKKGQEAFGDRKKWCERSAPEEQILLCRDLQAPERGKPSVMHPRDCCSSNCRDKHCALEREWRAYRGNTVVTQNNIFSFSRQNVIEKENLLPSWILINIYISGFNISHIQGDWKCPSSPQRFSLQCTAEIFGGIHSLRPII